MAKLAPEPPRVRHVRRDKSAYGQAMDYIAAGHGAPERPGNYTARFHGRCVRPLVMRQQDKSDGHVETTTDTWVRCRQCEPCLRYRRAFWAARMVQENLDAERSWFVTLTLNADALHVVNLLADVWLAEHGVKRAEAAVWQLAHAHGAGLGSLVQKWLKRIRKDASKRAKANGEVAPRLRFCMVFEYGSQEGRPHAHLLIHEAAGRILKEEMKSQWSRHGFARAELVKDRERAGWYAAKYLVKGLDVRLRASRFYGTPRGVSGGILPPSSTPSPDGKDPFGHSSPPEGERGSNLHRPHPMESTEPPLGGGAPALAGGGEAPTAPFAGPSPASDCGHQKQHWVTGLDANPTSAPFLVCLLGGQRASGRDPDPHIERSRPSLRVIVGDAGRNDQPRAVEHPGRDRETPGRPCPPH